MSITSLNQRLIAYKKLVGKSHTSAQLGDAGEPFASNVQMGTNEVFAQDPTTTDGAAIPGITTLVTFDLVATDANYGPNTSISEAEVSTVGMHAYKLVLPSGYNGNVGQAGDILADDIKLQVVSPKYGFVYSPEVYSGQERIFATGDSDWILDFYSGILFVQDVYGPISPDTLKAYLYTGKYVSDVVYTISETLPGEERSTTLLKAQVERLEVIRDGEPTPTFTNLVDKENAAKFSGSVGVSGDLEVNGTLHTKKLIVEETTQVITNTVSQANNIFGDEATSQAAGDTHTFYGDVNINGNLSVTGDGPNKKKVFEITRETALENPSSNSLIEIEMDSPPSGLSNMVKGNVFLINNLDSDSNTNDKIEIRLPNIAVHDLWNGIEYTFKHLCGEGHQVIITGAEGRGQQIDGNNSIFLHVQYETLTVVAYNGSWHIV